MRVEEDDDHHEYEYGVLKTQMADAARSEDAANAAWRDRRQYGWAHQLRRPFCVQRSLFGRVRIYGTMLHMWAAAWYRQQVLLLLQGMLPAYEWARQ